MSVHSDETDFLLHIPPDFYSVPSDDEYNQKPENSLVNDLICQVNELEGRIYMIEKKTRDEDSMSCSSQSNLRFLRQYGSVDALQTHHKHFQKSRSLQSTPMKTFTSTSSPGSWQTGDCEFKWEQRQNLLSSSTYMAQRDKDNKMLKEIDVFFKGKEKDAVSGETVPMPSISFDMTKVDQLLKQIDETKLEMERKLQLPDMGKIDKEVLKVSEFKLVIPSNLLVKDFNEKQENQIALTSPKKIPRRILNFDSPSKYGQENDTKPEAKVESNPKVDTGQTLENGQPEANSLVSLTNLWSSKPSIPKTTSFEDQQILKQRLEEERCRRKHCEEQIQQLHLRVLEEQQKVAVAINVDKEKDNAIHQLTEGWNKLIGHWRELEHQRNELAKQVIAEREKFESDITSTALTVKRYEAELSKALDLAHGYKEKCENSEKEQEQIHKSLINELEYYKSELKSTKEKLNFEENEKQNLFDQLQLKEETTTLSKSKISDLQKQIRELKKNLKELENEFENIKQEKEKVSEKYKDEKNKLISLEQGKKALLQQNEELKKRERVYKEEVKMLNVQVEKTKLELKEFYQDQVEHIVQGKVQEFQAQLQAAEKILLKEIETKERSAAMKQVQQIVEQHAVEVALLEEKRTEEVELWKVKVEQCEQKLLVLQKRLQSQLSQKDEIAEKLHSVMETQWQEALKIIRSSATSPQASPKIGGSRKTLSRQNTFTMTARGDGATETEVVPSSSSSPTTTTDTPFCKDDQVTYREQPGGPLTYRVNETPQKMTSNSEDSLKKYIQRLLERTPSCPGEDGDESLQRQWQDILSDTSSLQPQSSKSDRQPYSKEHKPPWK